MSFDGNVYTIDHELTREDAIQLVQAGLTPRALDHAYIYRGVRDLAKQAGAPSFVVRKLADRWGIRGRRDEECAA